MKWKDAGESEESLSGLEFDNDNELDDCSLLLSVVNDDSDEDDNVQDLFGKVWKITRDNEKNTWAVLDLKVLQNM
jgi:hypothetical protein